MRFSGRHFLGSCSKGGGYQQRLAWYCRCNWLASPLRGIHLALEPLVNNPLMRCVHVHHYQALLVFGQYVNALQLSQSSAQRPVFSLIYWGMSFKAAVACKARGWFLNPIEYARRKRHRGLVPHDFGGVEKLAGHQAFAGVGVDAGLVG